MKRDMELVNAILKFFESQPRGTLTTKAITDEVGQHDESKEKLVLNHLRIMQDAGYIALESGGIRLTWEGHDRVEAIREPLNISSEAVETFAKLGR